jgi:hypothetical protein
VEQQVPVIYDVQHVCKNGYKMKTILRLLFLFFVVGGFNGTVFGDGKVNVGEGVPADIPYQRAFIIFHEESETLILQSKYELSHTAAADSLGWVVPVPSVPKIASVDADIAWKFFFFISSKTKPKIHHINIYFFPIFVITLFVGTALLLLCLIQYPFLKKIGLSKISWKRRLLISLNMIIFAICFDGIIAPHLGAVRNVEVIKAEKAGIYDVKVIQSENAEAILGWLKENAFGFNENDTRVFEDYINRKWCFVVAKVQPEPGIKESKITYGRMVAPLILKFTTEKAVYPLALTSTIGKETEILLYTLSDNKFDCNKRLKLRFVNKSRPDNLISNLLTKAEQGTINFFKDLPQSMILCKFKDKLTPEQMKSDIIFESALDNKPYRETKVVC